MRVRAIHLSTKKRIRLLSQKFNLSLPDEWRGQFLFEVSRLETGIFLWLKELFTETNLEILKEDIREGYLLFRSCRFDDFERMKEAPEAVVEFVTRIRNFFKDEPQPIWEINGRTLDFSKSPLIMGILNVTPDSFSDGGRFNEPQSAIDHALRMVEEGAEIIDVGGESTRPGSEPVTEKEELKRVIPVIEKLRNKTNALISIDTYKSRVALKALKAGADIVNDISGAQFDPKMVRVVKNADCPLIIMHIKGTPRDMQKDPFYEDVVEEIYGYFEQRIEYLENEGVKKIIIDPGIGFGKRVEDNLHLLRDLKDFTFLSKPVLAGTSRKSFIGKILNREVDERLFGSVATQIVAVQNGAKIVRVHDVRATKDALKLWQSIMDA